jgi:hypothetical protein
MKYIFLVIIFSIISPILSFKEVRPKICVDCKHFIISNNGNEYGKCSLFPLKYDDDESFLVTGVKQDEIIDYYYCSTVRTSESDSMCGKYGKFHKKKYRKYNKNK